MGKGAKTTTKTTTRAKTGSKADTKNGAKAGARAGKTAKAADANTKTAKDSGIGKAATKETTVAAADAKVDLNSVGIVQLLDIKGIGRSRAEEIIRHRGKKGPFASVDDLADVPHVGDMPTEELAALKQKFIVRLPDDQAPPTAPAHAKVDINHANVEELRAVEGIGAERAEEIVRYREQIGGISDLAELDSLPHFRDEPEGQRGPIKARLKV